MATEPERGEQLAKTLLLEEMPERWLHVRQVANRATELCLALDLQGSDLIAAAWLHDVGYAAPLRATGFHPLDGARFILERGFSHRVAGLVAHHSCAVIEAEERGLREELLAEFPFRESPLTDALWYCDMTTGPEGQPMTVEERLAEIRKRYGPDDVVTRFVERASPELTGAVKRVEARLDAISRGTDGRYR